MRVLLINPSYQTITSNVGVGHQVPLGLLMVGGALIDAGHDVKLLDAEARTLPDRRIVRAVVDFDADVVMIGHAGSTPAHPVCMRTLSAIKAARPGVVTVYGGVFPSYHPHRVMRENATVDVIVRGEGEATAVSLMNALAQCRRERLVMSKALARVPNIAYRAADLVFTTERSTPMVNLDAYRIGWELIDDWDRYRCGGLGRAAVIQLSRGCPHRCTYCGQHGFWVKWRHRDPVKVTDEIEWLTREHGIRFITLADENPTTNPVVWNASLEELARRRLPVRFFATIRATDIVREKEKLPLWREAGILYVLMGIETTDEDVIRQINKRSTTRTDFEACRLLKENGILSVLGHIVGLADETWASFRRARRQLALYDGDFLNAMYVTPHAWTEFGREKSTAAVVQEDQSKWDYRHQILRQSTLSPLQIFLGVKWLEACFHLRPSKLLSIIAHPDAELRRQYRWAMSHMSAVWLAEIVEFFKLRFAKPPRPLSEFEETSDVIVIREGPMMTKPRATSRDLPMVKYR